MGIIGRVSSRIDQSGKIAGFIIRRARVRIPLLLPIEGALAGARDRIRGYSKKDLKKACWKHRMESQGNEVVYTEREALALRRNLKTIEADGDA